MKWLICKLLGHKYAVFAIPKEDWAKGIRWIYCKRCNKHWFINDTVRTMLPYNFALRDMHEWIFIKEISNA